MEALFAQVASGKSLVKPIQRLVDYFAFLSNDERDTASDKLATVMLSTSGAIKQLAQMLSSNDDGIKSRSMLIFSTLCDLSTEFRAEVASRYLDDVIPAIVYGAQPSSSNSEINIIAQEFSLVALEALARHGKAAHAAAAAGALDVLVHLMESVPSNAQDEVQSLAIEAFRQIVRASTNRARQAVSSGAIAVLSRLALSQSAATQLEAAACLHAILSAMTLAQMSTHSQHIKVAVAALARLLARSSIPGTTDAKAQSSASIALAGLLAAQMEGSMRRNTDEHRWVQVELSKALVRASAGPMLLQNGSAEAVMLIDLMTKMNPEHLPVLARSEGSIDRLKQLIQSPMPRVRAFAADMLLRLTALFPELGGAIGSDIDPEAVLREAIRECERLAAAAPSSSSCARCGADDGMDDVKLSECSACRRVSYCSKACQNAHWKVHKPSCVPRG